MRHGDPEDGDLVEPPPPFEFPTKSPTPSAR